MARTGGFTLVESMVTVALVAIVLVPLGRVLLTSQSAANDNSARQQALGLDTAVLAKIGVAPYGEVGLTAADQRLATGADPGYSGAAGGSLVTLAPGLDLDGAFGFGPGNVSFDVVMPSVLWGDRSFKVVTWVTQADAYVPACPQTRGTPLTTNVVGVERKVTVSASWFSQLSGWITATESTIVYPGGLAPYRGTASPPPVPSDPVVTTTDVTGRLDLSWTASASAGCYGISWITPDQAVHSTGLLADDDPAYVVPPPDSGTGTAEYAIDGLPQDQQLTFLVTAYSADGTVSTPSTDTAPAVPAPSGPLVTQVTSTSCPSGVASPCAYGGQGSGIEVSGSGLTSGATMTLVQAGQSQSIGTCSASPCSLSLSGLPTLSGTWSVVATSGGISSPPSPPSDFAFNPTITSLSPTTGTGGASVTVTGTNFLSEVTFTFSYSITNVNYTSTWTSPPCTPAATATVGATSCTLVMPDGINTALLAAGQSSTSGSVSAANSPGGSSPTTPGDVFTYTEGS